MKQGTSHFEGNTHTKQSNLLHVITKTGKNAHLKYQKFINQTMKHVFTYLPNATLKCCLFFYHTLRLCHTLLNMLIPVKSVLVSL